MESSRSRHARRLASPAFAVLITEKGLAEPSPSAQEQFGLQTIS
jgi:hypothetical protein